MIKCSWRALAGLGGCAVLLLTGVLTSTAATAAPAVPAGDGPPGFWWGTDSFPVTEPGRAPYQMPYLGGAYGGYIGMTGNWAYRRLQRRPRHDRRHQAELTRTQEA